MKIPPTLYENERLDEVNEAITLIQKKDGLTFGTDAYLLSAFIRASRRARAIELGAGTGIISLLLTARNKVRDTVMIELQPEFAELCERNVSLNGFTERIRTVKADIRKIDPSVIGYEADLVFSNPPYMRTDSGLPNQVTKKNIARHETAGGIEDFCLAASRLLKYGGKFAVVYRPDRLSQLFIRAKTYDLRTRNRPHTTVHGSRRKPKGRRHGAFRYPSPDPLPREQRSLLS